MAEEGQETKRRRRGGKGRSEGKGKGKGKQQQDEEKGKGDGGSKRAKKAAEKVENAAMAQALLDALQCPQPAEAKGSGKGGKKKRGKGDSGQKLLQIVTGQAAVPVGFDLGPPMPAPGKEGKKGKKGKGKGDMKGSKGKGKGKGEPKGKGKGSQSDRSMSDVTQLIEASCSDETSVLTPGDFDYRSKRFLHELLMRADRLHEEDPENVETGIARLQRALDLCVEVAKTKERDDVDNWRAYVSKLLRKEDLSLYDELKDRDISRRRQNE